MPAKFKSKEEALDDLRKRIGRPDESAESIAKVITRIRRQTPQYERHILAVELHWGLKKGAPMTFQEIADLDEYLVTRERIREMAMLIVAMLRDETWE